MAGLVEQVLGLVDLAAGDQAVGVVVEDCGVANGVGLPVASPGLPDGTVEQSVDVVAVAAGDGRTGDGP
ncbi:hypothetical protein E4K73_48170 [Streptomyces sp. IB201691-2A2]|nr:hypothetical protein E4K73_48170 [Streptomyces sp. IB201691-2A2]